MDSLLSIEQSLDSLEETLAPLLEEDLSQTLSQLDLLQKAKLQVLLPYVVNDLVFIYLKTRGINPKTHPVFGELDRVKQYFDKIKKAEDPSKRRFAVDQGAATRFIKHAIKESRVAQEQAQRDEVQGTHTRFVDATVVGSSASAAATAKIQARTAQNIGEDSSSEGSNLEVFSGESEHVIANYPKGKGTERMEVETSTNKKRQRRMDLWAGYDEAGTTALSGNGEDPEGPQQKKTKADLVTLSEMQDDSGLVHEDIQMQERRMGVQDKTAREKKKTQPTEITDADALLESSGIHTKTVMRQASRVLSVDAPDSSRSSTPLQGVSKKKKKRQKQRASVTLTD